MRIFELVEKTNTPYIQKIKRKNFFAPWGICLETAKGKFLQNYSNFYSVQ